MLNFQGLLSYEGDKNAVPLGVNKLQIWSSLGYSGYTVQ